MSSRYHRLFIYDVKRTTKIDGMGPFKTKDSQIRILGELSETIASSQDLIQIPSCHSTVCRNDRAWNKEKVPYIREQFNLCKLNSTPP